MFDIGRVCMKLAGRDAGMRCVIVDTVDNHTVIIDGETRRRKCNTRHLEPTDKIVSVTKGASTADVAKATHALGFSMPTKKAEKKTAPKKAPRKQKATKTKPVKAPSKKAAASKKADKEQKE